jgi:sugar/nucleoside kinase (ribokinase family)
LIAGYLPGSLSKRERTLSIIVPRSLFSGYYVLSVQGASQLGAINTKTMEPQMNKSFVSVGVTILDIVGYPISSIPEGEGTEVINQIHLCAAGTAAAPAVIAARMGMDSTLIGAIAADDVGFLIRHKLDKEGVDTSLLELRSDLPTAVTMLPINPNGGRPNWHMPGAFLLMEISDAARERIVNADHVHLGGIGLLLNLDGEKAADLLAEARANGAITTGDLISPGPQTPEAVKAVAPHLDYFMPSIDEALEISGETEIEVAAEFFLDQGAGGCLIKCGSDGAYLATTDGARTQIPVMANVNVIDTSGCGDAFCAGFQVGLANGMPPERAASFAAATAAQVASAVGSDGGVTDYNTTYKIMQAGAMNTGENS